MAPEVQGELLAGRYRRLRTIGVGGMARVHLAEDERLGRRVAVKQMHADSPEEVRLRFEREAKLGASLNHPNLVSIFDIDSDSESVLIVMEYVEGETLQDTIGRGALPPSRVAEIVSDVAAGLDHAHRHGIVHRDVKPANVLLRHDGMAKLADLGIASAAEQTSITRSGVVMGTAAYMAPEQLEGAATSPRTDVYALAAVAFEALSGVKPRSGRTPIEIAHEMVSGPPPDLARVWPAAPSGVAAALVHGMARKPADRTASAGALAAELKRGSRQPRRAPTPTAPQAIPTLPVSRGRSRQGWRPAAAVALAALVALVVGFAVLSGGDDGTSDPPRDVTASDRTSGDRPAGSGSRNAAAGAGVADAPAQSDAAPRAPSPEPVSADPSTLNDEGYALMQAGRYDDAIPLLERAVAAYPEGSQELTYAYALYNLGRSLRLAGRPDEAVPVLERRLTIPNQTETVRRELDAARAAAG
jgi:serine/threonine protein kinase